MSSRETAAVQPLAPGTTLEIWACDGGANQVWSQRQPSACLRAPFALIDSLSWPVVGFRGAEGENQW